MWARPNWRPHEGVRVPPGDRPRHGPIDGDPSYPRPHAVGRSDLSWQTTDRRQPCRPSAAGTQAAAASARSSPSNHRVPDADRRQPADALCEQAPGRRVQRAVACRVARRGQSTLEAPMPAAAAASARISGSSRSNPPQNASRLAASANRAPAPISPACAAARSAPGALRREAVGPDERKPQSHRTGLRVRTHRRRWLRALSRPRKIVAAVGIHSTSPSTRSTRSAARYENGQARSKKKAGRALCARGVSDPHGARRGRSVLPLQTLNGRRRKNWRKTLIELARTSGVAPGQVVR